MWGEGANAATLLKVGRLFSTLTFVYLRLMGIYVRRFDFLHFPVILTQAKKIRSQQE